MANQLKMAIVHSILHLHSLHWSRRRIAAELNIDRGTVGRYLSRHLGGANAAIPPAGSAASNAATWSGSPGPPCAPAGGADLDEVAADSKPAISPAGSGTSGGPSNAAIPPTGAVDETVVDAAAADASAPTARAGRQEPGRFSSSLEDLHPRKISGLERGAAYLLKKASVIGPHTERWAEAMLTARGIEGTRVLMGLLSLTNKHPSDTVENACETALSYGAFRLRTLRQLLTRRAEQQTPLPFLDEHPLIRPLDDYATFIQGVYCFSPTETAG